MKKQHHNSQHFGLKDGLKDDLQDDQQDSDLFNDYLKGDSMLSELYQHLDAVEPSQQLDEQILSAARIQVSKPHKAYWKPAFSLAASLVILSLTGLLSYQLWQAEQQKSTQSSAALAPAGTHPVPVPATQLKESSRQNNPASDIQKAQQANVLSDAIVNEPERPPLAEKPANTPLMSKSVAHDKQPDDNGQILSSKARASSKESAMSPIALPKHKPILATQSPNKVMDEETKRLSKRHSSTQQDEPRVMLDSIRQLIAEQKITQAQQLLREFNTKYPQYPIDPMILKHLSPY